MKLKEELYTIAGKTVADGSTIVTVDLNPACFIYKAHFPGNPITPGVCIVQTACELLSDITGRQLEIKEVKDVKFLNILSPTKNTKIDFVFSNIETTEDSVKAKVLVKADDVTFTSISFVCA